MRESANVELVRSIFAEWARGDFSSAEWAHPQIEFAYVGGPDPSSSIGLSAYAERWRDFASAWKGYRVEAEVIRALDDERVLVLSRASTRGKASGSELVGDQRSRHAVLFQVRDGKVTKHVVYFDRDRALADLGLAPGSG